MFEDVGIIKIFAGEYYRIPQNWKLCDGSLITTADYPALFKLIGYAYGGSGDEFALPDMRCRVPIGAGTGYELSPIVLGSTGGNEDVTISVNHMAAHTHVANVAQNGSLQVSSGNSTVSMPVADVSIAAPGTLVGSVFTPSLGFNNSTPDVVLNSASIAIDDPAFINDFPMGQGGPLNIMQPFLGVNYMIHVLPD